MRSVVARGAVTTIAIVAASCSDTLAPGTTPSMEKQVRMSAAAAGEQVAYVLCGLDGDWNVLCEFRFPDGVLPEFYGAAWSPDAAKIAGSTRGEIKVHTIASNSAVTLTNDPSTDMAPTWSPDGSRIAFASDRGGVWNIYAMNAIDGSNVTRVTSGVQVANGGNPDWSPDGARILFDCEIAAGNRDLCSINVDGSGLVRLTSDPSADKGGDWSPDGTRIAFTTLRGGFDHVAIMGAGGANVALVGPGASFSPAWSPGGSRIAFTIYSQEASCQYYCENGIYVMNADGTAAVRYATGSDPVWRPAAGDTPPAPDTPPTAAFDYSCSNLTCDFFSRSSDDHEIVSTTWDHGDGTAEVPGTSHWYKFAAPGTYQVTIKVTDGLGQMATATRSVTVPVTPPPPQIWGICTHLKCNFTMIVVDPYIVSYEWMFGNGTTSNQLNPTHTYTVAGTYQVSGTIRNAAGQSSTSWTSVTVTAPPPPPDYPPVARIVYSCSASTCKFDGRTSTDDVGIVAYTWSLGTAGAATGSVVAAKFKGRTSQNITLTVRDTKGQTGSATVTLVFR